MGPRNFHILIGVIISLICKIHGVCDKTPDEVNKPRNRNEVGRYIIEISGNPKNYTPNQLYNISLKVDPYLHPQKQFKKFLLTLESSSGHEDITTDLGRLDPGHDSLSKFSHSCKNTIVETNNQLKSEIQVFWIAPSKGSGCVFIKGTVIESKDNWFSEDGPLTKKLCEEVVDLNSQPPILRHCYACDEAKYELAFEGKWIRNTHPKDFPSDAWSTGFSDIIGVSHQLHHAFWNYDDFPSQGLMELAENGSTLTLESELKEMSENIRTIIKIRGLTFPNANKTAHVPFRVDAKNHLVSLVAKIVPSPDWIVGVSNLELCTDRGSWAESVTLNLFPHDVGTNDGITYTASQPVPKGRRNPIRPITANNPNNPDSPFYSEDGEEIKPIAKLHLVRQRLYEKPCSITPPTDPFSPKEECATTLWAEWLPCSVTCGKGITFRQREYIDPSNAEQCNVNLVDWRFCNAKDCETMDTTASPTPTTVTECEEDGKNCQTTQPNCPEWGPWSECNVTCGHGYRIRMRNPPNSLNENNNEEEETCPGQEIEECMTICTTEGKVTKYYRTQKFSHDLSQSIQKNL